MNISYLSLNSNFFRGYLESILTTNQSYNQKNSLITAVVHDIIDIISYDNSHPVQLKKPWQTLYEVVCLVDLHNYLIKIAKESFQNSDFINYVKINQIAIPMILSKRGQ